jgi:hypothetical protein
MSRLQEIEVRFKGLTLSLQEIEVIKTMVCTNVSNFFSLICMDIKNCFGAENASMSVLSLDMIFWWQLVNVYEWPLLVLLVSQPI